jgi:hypothetical protein
VLTELWSPAQPGRFDAGEAERRPGVQGGRYIVVRNGNEELPSLQVRVQEDFVGRVDRPDGQAPGLPFVIGLFGGLQQKEGLDDFLNVAEVVLAE